jgi:carbon-monoxide dehydrogenase large subunit
VYPAVQMPHRYWSEIAEETGLDQAEVRDRAERGRRVRGQGVGNVEHYVVAACAAPRSRGEVVEARSENLVAMAHGRGQVQYIEMGFTRDGVIRGCDAAWWATPALRRLRRRARRRDHA